MKKIRKYLLVIRCNMLYLIENGAYLKIGFTTNLQSRINNIVICVLRLKLIFRAE